MTNPKLIAAMREPSFYPHGPDRVECIQTHASFIFLTGEFVFKVKKAVDYGFLDFTTLARRRWFCEEELRLNRRLAPDIYLEVLPLIMDAEGRPALGGPGNPIEYTLKMKRLPLSEMLKDRLKDGVDPVIMDRLAAKIAAFHREAATGGEIDRMGSRSVIETNQEENFQQTQKYIDVTITRAQFDFIRDYSRAFRHNQAELLDRRVRMGRIRECHGDLHLEHICLTPEITIFDCIEFNERFRYGDVAAEVAFLAMDLDFNGYEEVADNFVAAYVKHAQDQEILTLLDFYRAYYAYVRGKVTSFRLDDANISEEEKGEVIKKAKRYFDLAFNYAGRPQEKFLVVITGLMGTGKSRLARNLSERLRIPSCNSDVVRKELAPPPADSSRKENYGQGIYRKDMTELTYGKLIAWAEERLRLGQSAILDASFKTRAHRELARNLAKSSGAECLLIECVAPLEVIRERLTARQNDPAEPSDGRWELWATQKDDFESFQEEEKPLVIDTNGIESDYLARIFSRISHLD